MSKFIKTHFFYHFIFPLPILTKMREIKIFYILPLFYHPTIFYLLTFPLLQPNSLIRINLPVECPFGTVYLTKTESFFAKSTVEQDKN